MSVYRVVGRGKETKRGEKTEETRERETRKEIRKRRKKLYSAEHLKFNTFIDVGFLTF